MNQKNIVIFGGAFDPVHYGHMQVASTAIEKLDIDQVWFIPSAVPPLKSDTMFTFEQRVELLKEAIKDNEKFVVYEGDLNENEKSYTILLVQKLLNQFPDYNFSFLIGADNVVNLQKWFEYEKLLDMIQFIVIDRETNDSDQWASLPYLHKLQFLKMPLVNISSSEIRKKLKG